VWAVAYVLLGLRYSPALAAQLFQGVVSMKESSTYQAILEEGRAEGRVEGLAEGLAKGAAIQTRKLLWVQGEATFGPPDEQTAALIEGLDLTRLEELFQRFPTAKSWQELLAPPTTGRRRGRRPSP
jgi:predicted transposase YdaD